MIATVRTDKSLFTADAFRRMAARGDFADRRVELLGGEVYEVAPQSNVHALGVDFLRDALVAAFGPGYWVRAQMSLDLSPYSVPDPDIAVVTGSRGSNRGRRHNPTTAVLIAEVSDTTLRLDRTRKASLYAAAGIPEYWILNIPDRRIEVRRTPVAVPVAEFGYDYADASDVLPGGRAEPLLLPGGFVIVDDVLPN